MDPKNWRVCDESLWRDSPRFWNPRTNWADETVTAVCSLQIRFSNLLRHWLHRVCLAWKLEDQGVISLTFASSPKYSLEICVLQKSYISYENYQLKLCTCAQNHGLGTCTKFQLEILTINVISGIVYFHEIIWESLQNVSETTPRQSFQKGFTSLWSKFCRNTHSSHMKKNDPIKSQFCTHHNSSVVETCAKWRLDWIINVLWPSYAMWRLRSGSTLAQLMACCQKAPSH